MFSPSELGTCFGRHIKRALRLRETKETHLTKIKNIMFSFSLGNACPSNVFFSLQLQRKTTLSKKYVEE